MKYITPIFLVCSIGLFATSLWFPAFCIERSAVGGGVCEPHWSISSLFLGWLYMLLAGTAGFTWLANPLLLFAWITSMVLWRTSSRGLAAIVVLTLLSLVFSVFAVIFSASFLLCTKFDVNVLAGITCPICHRLPGYWLWLSSAIVMFAGNGIALAFTDLTGKKSAMNQIDHSDQTIHSNQAAHSDQTVHSNRTIPFNVKFNRL